MSRRRKDSLRHGLRCPNCNATFGRHGRGGKRRCRCGPVECCPGIRCTCKGQDHFVLRSGELIWRRSPCPSVKCGHCGWTGTLESEYFESDFGMSRCPRSQDGLHEIDSVVRQREFPGKLTIMLFCKKCSSFGYTEIDPVKGIRWVDTEGERKSESDDASNVSRDRSTGDHVGRVRSSRYARLWTGQGGLGNEASYRGSYCHPFRHDPNRKP